MCNTGAMKIMLDNATIKDGLTLTIPQAHMVVSFDNLDPENHRLRIRCFRGYPIQGKPLIRLPGLNSTYCNCVSMSNASVFIFFCRVSIEVSGVNILIELSPPRVWRSRPRSGGRTSAAWLPVAERP